MRSRIASVFSDALASANIPVFDIASRYAEIGEALLPIINPIVSSRYGLEIPTFVLENVSVPAEVEKAIDTRASMAAIGDLNEYVKYQLAEGMAKGGSSGGVAAEMAVGLSVAQQILQQQGFGRSAALSSSVPELMSPQEVAGVLGVPEQDVMSIIDTGELAAKKIGASYRIRRSDLDSYLNR
jgi:excisionase family DNA binding protein